MNELTDRLARLDVTDGPPPETVVAADVRRGRTAHTRRRTRRTVAGSVAGVVVVVAGVAALGGGTGADRTDAPIADTPSVTAETSPPTAPATGTPTATPTTSTTSSPAPPSTAAFSVASVPEGLVVQGADFFATVISRAGDTTSPYAYKDKLVVTFEDAYAPPGKYRGRPITINGQPGAIDSADTDPATEHEDLATTLEFQLGEYDVLVQSWVSLGLTDDQLIAFAEGISVNPGATPPTP